MKTAHVVFNPASGSFSSKRAERILTALRNSGIDPRPLMPASEADAISQVNHLCRNGEQPLIIAVGGDGTINTVINGMTEKSAILGVIPLGTANVLALELGIRSIDDAVKRIATGTVRDFTVGEAKAAMGTRRFMLMAGIGIDGAVVAKVRSAEKKHLGRLAYLLSALRVLRKWDQTQQVVSDSQHSAECHSVVVANAANYGGPFCLAPQAGIFTPHLQVIPLMLSTRFSLIRLAISMLKIRKSPMSGTWLHNTGELHFGGTKAIQIDGDSFGNGPMIVRSIPAFNRIIC
jgi:diacylglycerol kinase (ATP)